MSTIAEHIASIRGYKDQRRGFSDIAQSAYQSAIYLFVDTHLDEIAAALSEIAAEEAQGWQLVPREVSKAMKDAAMEILLERGDIYSRDGQIVIETITPSDLWRAMLAAAPGKAQGSIPMTERLPSMQWPKDKAAERAEDMGTGTLRIVLDSDNDVSVAVWTNRGSRSVEFCNPGGGGGGQSPETRKALIALMVAIEADNEKAPVGRATPPPEEARPGAETGK